MSLLPIAKSQQSGRLYSVSN